MSNYEIGSQTLSATTPEQMALTRKNEARIYGAEISRCTNVVQLLYNYKAAHWQLGSLLCEFEKDGVITKLETEAKKLLEARLRELNVPFTPC